MQPVERREIRPPGRRAIPRPRVAPRPRPARSGVTSRWKPVGRRAAHSIPVVWPEAVDDRVRAGEGRLEFGVPGRHDVENGGLRPGRLPAGWAPPRIPATAWPRPARSATIVRPSRPVEARTTTRMARIVQVHPDRRSPGQTPRPAVGSAQRGCPRTHLMSTLVDLAECGVLRRDRVVAHHTRTSAHTRSPTRARSPHSTVGGATPPVPSGSCIADSSSPRFRAQPPRVAGRVRRQRQEAEDPTNRVEQGQDHPRHRQGAVTIDLKSSSAVPTGLAGCPPPRGPVSSTRPRRSSRARSARSSTARRDRRDGRDRREDLDVFFSPKLAPPIDMADLGAPTQRCCSSPTPGS